MIDVDKILQLDYLNSLISQINNTISEKKSLFVLEYDFEQLLIMSLEDINKLFSNYNVDNANLLRYVESDFLDESWEFADLYLDDIGFSSEQKGKLSDLAMIDVANLNQVIRENNINIQKEIDKLTSNLKRIDTFIKILNDDDLIVDEEVDELKEFIIYNSLIPDKDRFKLSVNVVKYLISTGKKILLKKELVDTDEFERKLDEVRNNALINDVTVGGRKIADLPYCDVIEEYYEKYKELFNENGYSDILEFMMDASELYKEIDDEANSISKSDFCIKVAGLLYNLNFVIDEETNKEILDKLKELDDLYLLNNKFKKFRNKNLEKIAEFRDRLNDDGLSSTDDKTRLLNILKLLQDELLNNIINSDRKDEIEKAIDSLSESIDKLFDDKNRLNEIDEYNNRIKELISLPMIVYLLGTNLYNELIELQGNFLNLREEINENGFTSDMDLKLTKYKYVLSCVEEKLENSSGEKKDTTELTTLKGFVLFDVSSSGDTYVVVDLDPSHKDRLIDKAIANDKLKKGYEDYNKLIRDLHIIGNTERLSNNSSHGYNNDKLNEPVYYDTENKTHENETGMYRLKYDRNGVERFVERKVVLHPGTKMCEQVTGVIKKILPDVDFDYSADIILYINFASAMKLDDIETYGKAIKRYTKGPLYKMFFDDKNKESLSENECKLLEDFIHLTLQSYAELEKKNPYLQFDIIRQMGGMKTRG